KRHRRLSYRRRFYRTGSQGCWSSPLPPFSYCTLEGCAGHTVRDSVDDATPEKSVRQRSAINVFEFAPERHAVRDPARRHVMPAGHVREVVSRSITLNRRIGCDNELVEILTGESLLEFLQPQFLRAYAIQGGQVPHQHEVVPSVTRRILYRHDVGRRLDYTKKGFIPAGGTTDVTQLLFGEHPAATAMPDTFYRGGERLRQL